MPAFAVRRPDGSSRLGAVLLRKFVKAHCCGSHYSAGVSQTKPHRPLQIHPPLIRVPAAQPASGRSCRLAVATPRCCLRLIDSVFVTTVIFAIAFVPSWVSFGSKD